MQDFGFLKYERKENNTIDSSERIKNYNEFHTSLSLEDRKNQASRCMNCGVPFCGAGMNVKGITVGCPLHNYIPEWNKLISLGLYYEAYERLMITTSFPEFTGRVCPALCEAACINNIDSKPTSIKDNELFLIEEAYKNGWVKPNNSIIKRNETIAVIGSGPAGLACANELNKEGFKVTVFEKSDRFGGLLMYGIPNMKLDKKIVDRRIDIMKKSGINFVNNFDCLESSNKKTITLFDYVCFATGTGKCRDLNIPGRNLKNVLFATDYLTDNTKALLDIKTPTYNAEDLNVLVIGGGDTGNDCVGTAIRQHAKSVIQFEIMPSPPKERTNSWPEWPNALKVDYGAAEAIYEYGNDIRKFKTTATSFNGKVKVESVSCCEVDFVLENGIRKMNYDLSKAITYPVDLVILSMGFLGTSDNILTAYNLPSDKRGNILTNDYQIPNTKYFACGDSATGQSLVVKAIDSGRKCAKKIIDFINNKD